MVKNTKFASEWFWNFIGFGLMCFAIGSAWSVSRAKTYQLELAQYKLAVGGALSDVQKVSDTLEKSAERLPIAPKVKRKIQQQINESNAVIEQVQTEIDQEIKELNEEEIE